MFCKAHRAVTQGFVPPLVVSGLCFDILRLSVCPGFELIQKSRLIRRSALLNNHDAGYLACVILLWHGAGLHVRFRGHW